MNIGLFRLRPLIKELRGIHFELKRSNDIREFELARLHNVHMNPVNAGGNDALEPEAIYTNEEADYFRELAEELGKRARVNEEAAPEAGEE